jgi:FlaA1/EpsC-like NDP-sugar epimerase
VGAEWGWPSLTRTIAGVRSDVSFALVDAAIVVLAYLGALVIRFSDQQIALIANWWDGFLIYLPVVVCVHLLINALLGAYGQVWEYASVEEAMRLVVASLLSALLLLIGLVVIRDVTDAPTRLVPLTVVVLGSGLVLGGMGAVRFRTRVFSFRRTLNRDFRRTLVVGTGREAADLVRRGDTLTPPVSVVGFVDDHPLKGRLAGVPVVGGIDDLRSLVSELQVDETVVASRVGPEAVRRVVDACMDVDVRLRTLPDMDSVMGSGSISDVRDLELSDLLPRSTVSTDLRAVADLLCGKRVLVTGAGGSIGSEIVQQASGFGPSEILALDHDEGHLYQASLSWDQLDLLPNPCLVDVCDRRAVDRVFDQFRPDIVFHAAAHKHVPMLELFPEEAVKTNVVGTRNLIEATQRYQVERFVLISTDKAVEPSSVMGASKRVAEMMIQTAADASFNGTVFSSVRFGNVLGSRGSVIPTFMQQIQSGGPVTVSDPDMLRYFMLTCEAVELVLQAAALSEGGEIFVLDMGEPIRIGDLAHRMIRLSGLVPGRDVSIEITGARPGEKLVEKLSLEPLEPSAHPQISLAATPYPGSVTVLDAADLLESLAERGDRPGIRDLLMGLAWQTWTGGEAIDIEALTSQVMGESV